MTSQSDVDVLSEIFKVHDNNLVLHNVNIAIKRVYMCLQSCGEDERERGIMRVVTRELVLQVMFPSACSFIVLVFTVFHYMFHYGNITCKTP
jgi:hypothetical protein